MLLNIVDDSRKYVLTVTSMKSGKQIAQDIVLPPLSKYKTQKHRKLMLEKYPEIVKVTYKENGYSREEILQKY